MRVVLHIYPFKIRLNVIEHSHLGIHIFFSFKVVAPILGVVLWD